MKLYVQWAQSNPQDWVLMDSVQWHMIPKKAEPRGGERIDDIAGWVHDLCIMGMTFSFDHYAVEDIPGNGCQVTVWNDDPEDYPAGHRYGMVYSFLPLAPDPRFGGAMNTRISRAVYAEEHAPWFPDETIHPWRDFPFSSPSFVRHGIWVPDRLNMGHKAMQRRHGWREWVDGVPSEMVANGRVKSQRALGLYDKPQGTKTVFARDTDRANGIHNAVHEDAFEETTATPTTESRLIPTGTAELGWCFTSASGFPNDGAWPTGDYRFQIDASSLDANISFGLLTIGSANGHFARVNSALTSDLETKVQQEAAFSSAGLQLATTGSVSWAAGATTDRFECLLAIENSNNHNERTITLELNESDDFADGPWPSGVGGIVSATRRQRVLSGILGR